MIIIQVYMYDVQYDVKKEKKKEDNNIRILLLTP